MMLWKSVYHYQGFKCTHETVWIINMYRFIDKHVHLHFTFYGKQEVLLKPPKEEYYTQPLS